MSARIVFLGSKPIGYDCLEHLIDQAAGLGISICAVRTRSRTEFAAEKDLAALAKRHNIPLLTSLEEIPECDFIYSVQHHELLKERHLKKAGQLAVNLHLAPLPEYRGCNQFSFAIMDEAETFGVTLHKMDTRIDHGAVLFEKRFPIPEGCWVDDLYRISVGEALILFKETLPLLLSGQYRIPAALEPGREGSLHFRSEINDLKSIDLGLPRKEIEKRIRATSMPGFEPPYCLVDGRKIYFTGKSAGINGQPAAAGEAAGKNIA